MSAGPEHVVLGVVRTVNTARRELRIRPRPGKARMLENSEWLLVEMEGAVMRCKVAALRVQQDLVIAELAPGVPRDTVARMKNAGIVADAETGRGGEVEDVDVTDLMDFTVEGTAGTLVGVITDAFEQPAHGVIEITRPGGRRMLVPLVDAVVQELDWERRTLIVGDLTPFAVDHAD